jgi:hypothetical protein
MLTASLKKKMDVQRAVEKRNAAAVARRGAEEVRRKSEERSLHFAGRLLRRSEAEKQTRRPASVGMTGVAGGIKGAKNVARSANGHGHAGKGTTTAQAAAAHSAQTGPKLVVASKAAKRATAKRAAPAKKAKKVSGASKKRHRG